MGRTIKFEIRKDGKISNADKKIFTQINNKYNSENIKWSCENFWIDLDAGKYNKYPNTTRSGYIKTLGNEFNTALVYLALIELSEQIEDIEINVEDEGEFLICPVLLKNGKASPYTEPVIKNINLNAMRTLFYDDKYKEQCICPENMSE